MVQLCTDRIVNQEQFGSASEDVVRGEVFAVYGLIELYQVITMEAVGRAISAADWEQFENVYGELRAALTIHMRHEHELLASAMQPGVGSEEVVLKIARL